ncbi:MAG: hypothetical protein LBE62_12560 [Azonexus sp.]|nr:hypothetical protein [Azonexus sp.]
MKFLPACLLFLAVIAPASGEPRLGRLFLTPEARQALDQQRLRDPGSDAGQRLTINGEIRRAGRPTMRWINGHPDWQGQATPPPAPVGDSFDPVSGERQPLLGGGRITVTPPQP